MNQDNRFDPPQPFSQQGTSTQQFDPNLPQGYTAAGQPVFHSPQTPAPRKNWFARHKILTVIGAIILVIVLANAFGGGSKDPATVTTPAATAAAPEEQEAAPDKAEAGGYRIGDVATVGDMAYKVVSVETATEVGPSFSVTKAKGTFLILKIEVTNNANESALVDASFFALKSGDKKYDADSTASLWANTAEDGGNDSFFLESLNPDLTMSGIVVFDVSGSVADAEQNVLVAQTGFWGTETIDILLTN